MTRYTTRPLRIDIMTPLKPVSPRRRFWLGLAFFVVFTAVWAAATFGGFVSKTFLADPVTMVTSGWTLLTEMGFAKDIGITMWRVFGGFVIAAVLAVPLGCLLYTSPSPRDRQKSRMPSSA